MQEVSDLSIYRSQKIQAVVDELYNDYQKAKDKSETTFPETQAAALKLLTKRRGDDNKSSKKDDFEDGVISFYQQCATGCKKQFSKRCFK